MNYSIFARSLIEAAKLANDRGWGPNQWIPFLWDTDEPYARVRGHYDQTA